MALFILIIALLIEAGLSIYCIKTKSNQKKIKNYIRLGELILMIIFTLLPVIEWSLRWKALMLILAVKAVIAGISLLLKKEDKKYSPARIVLRSIGSFILISVTLVPAFVFPQYKLPDMTGGHEITTTTCTYVDESRAESFTDTGEKREVNVEFWYPSDALEGEKFPLVVFSHGAFGVKASNTSAYMELASNGYVVCSIDHPYHSMGTIDANGKFTMVSQQFMQQVFDCNNGVYTDEEIFELEQEWMNIRIPDMEFVLDTVLSSDDLPVYQLIDSQNIGLMGHSMGGAASAQVARERDDIKCVMNIEGTMMGEFIGFDNGTEIINPEPYPVPILNVYTDNVMNQLEGYPDYVFVNDVVSATAPAHYELILRGTNHMGVTDLSLVSPFLCNMIQANVPKVESTNKVSKLQVINNLNAATLEFFNYYLKGEGNCEIEQYDIE